MTISPLIFVHIFKAAGTTVQRQLRDDALGWSAVPQINSDARFAGRMADALADPRVRAICGHAHYADFADAFERAGRGAPEAFTLVRPPLERAVSAYDYFRAAEYEPLHEAALELPPEAFFPHWQKVQPDALRGHQCRALAADGTPTAEAALDGLGSRFAFVGTVADMPALGRFLHGRLGIPFDPARRENRSPSVLAGRPLSRTVREMLLDATREDAKLVDQIARRGPLGTAAGGLT